jgi:hypothetical protein
MISYHAKSLSNVMLACKCGYRAARVVYWGGPASGGQPGSSAERHCAYGGPTKAETYISSREAVYIQNTALT